MNFRRYLNDLILSHFSTKALDVTAIVTIVRQKLSCSLTKPLSPMLSALLDSQVLLLTQQSVLKEIHQSTTLSATVSLIYEIFKYFYDFYMYCAGDSGGPLSIIRDGASYQVGVVSFGPAAGYFL